MFALSCSRCSCFLLLTIRLNVSHIALRQHRTNGNNGRLPVYRSCFCWCLLGWTYLLPRPALQGLSHNLYNQHTALSCAQPSQPPAKGEGDSRRTEREGSRKESKGERPRDQKKKVKEESKGGKRAEGAGERRTERSEQTTAGEERETKKQYYSRSRKIEVIRAIANAWSSLMFGR